MLATKREREGQKGAVGMGGSSKTRRFVYDEIMMSVACISSGHVVLAIVLGLVINGSFSVGECVFLVALLMEHRVYE